MSLQDQLYKAAILEHYKHPRNRGTLPPPAKSKTGINPTCGDELELFVQLDNKQLDNQTVQDVKFIGEGCAISQASASLLTQSIKGKTLSEVNALSTDFNAMLRGEPLAEDLGELKVLQGVAKLHARIKCAALPWKTLEQILKDV